MNRTLDVEIRRAMAELAQAAPMPRPVEVVEAAGTSSRRAMPARARRRNWAFATASFAAGALVVSIVVVTRRDDRPRTHSVAPATIDSTVPVAIWSAPTVVAAVVTSLPGTSDELVIDEGSDRGILVGMPVVNGAGLVGRVIRVEPRRSIVQLVTSPRFAIGSEARPLDGEGRVSGVVHGSGHGEPLTMEIPADQATPVESLAVGDIVETGRGANSLAPAGIPIGPIQSIRVGAGGENTVLTLRWAAQVDLTTVVVVLYVPTLISADRQS